MDCTYLYCTMALRGIGPNLGDNTSELRIITWPAEQLPIPAVSVGPARLAGDGFIEVWLPWNSSEEQRVVVPEELYLRDLMTLALDDPSAILKFAAAYGTVIVPSLAKVLSAAQGRPDPETEDVERLRERESEMHFSTIEHARVCMESTFAGVRAAPPNQQESLLDAVERIGMISPRLTCHVDEFRWSVQLLRDMVRIWLANQGSLTFAEVRAQWESPVRPAGASPENWPSREACARILAVGLNQGLDRVRARIGLVDEEGMPDPAVEKDYEKPDLFSVLCLQFTNHIAENARYWRCQNKNCGRWFVRQSERAAVGQYRRKGVKYCSKRCAKAVSQRCYQERLTSAKRGAGDEGAS